MAVYESWSREALIAELERRDRIGDLDRHAVALAAQEQRVHSARTRFLAAAGHDLRQPLNALNLFLGVLRATKSQDRALEIAAGMQASLDSLIEQFNGLLDLAKLDMGAIDVRPELVDANEFLEDLLVDFETAAQAKGLRFHIIPSTAAVWTDRELFQRVLRQLTAFSIAATSQGGVIAGCRRAGGFVRFDVVDTSPGLSDTDCHAIFEPFHRTADRLRDKTPGHAPGLAAVGPIARLLGHHVTVSSIPGKGTRFSVAVSRSEALTPSKPEPTVTAGLPFDGAGCTVLVIEDDTVSRSAISTLLAGFGFTIHAVPSAEAALQRLETIGPSLSLILSDYHLAGTMDGLQAIATMRSILRRTVPACILTAEALHPLRPLVEQHGILLLRKPLRPESAERLFQLASEAANALPRRGEQPPQCGSCQPPDSGSN